MDKYIKESDLFKRILNVDFKHDYDGCIKFCQSIPAADVEEVRHGKKKVYYHGENAFSYACDQCAMPIDGKDSFCRWCGAKMDEVEDEK